MRKTGHMHFQRTFDDFAELTVSGMPTELQPAQVRRVIT
jgi:hypothetical protein